MACARLAIGPAVPRLVVVADPIGRPLRDVLVALPALTSALGRAEVGESSRLIVELGQTWLDVRFVAQVAADGAVLGGLVLATDATISTRAVDALRQSAGDAETENEQRAQALDRLVAADRAREEALTSVVHDDVLQLLSALAWRLDALAGRLEGSPATEASTLAEQARAASQRLGAALDEAGVAADADGDDLMEALEHQAVAAGLGPQLVATDELTGLVPPVIARVLVEIAADAFANVAAHAGATSVEVTARPQDAGIAVIVRDDGGGFDVADVAGRSRGIALMRERARVAGGWVRVDSRRGRGTTVHAWVPLR